MKVRGIPFDKYFKRFDRQRSAVVIALYFMTSLFVKIFDD